MDGDTEPTLLPQGCTGAEDVTLIPEAVVDAPIPVANENPVAAPRREDETSFDVTRSTPEVPGADETYWPEWKREQAMEAPNREAEAWARNLRGGDEEDVPNSDPLVFGKPREKVRRKSQGPQSGVTRGVLEQQNFKSEVDSWQAGLRGGEEAAEKDPLVFSNPSYRKPSNEKRSPSLSKVASAAPAPRPPRLAPETPPKLKKTSIERPSDAQETKKSGGSGVARRCVSQPPASSQRAAAAPSCRSPPLPRQRGGSGQSDAGKNKLPDITQHPSRIARSSSRHRDPQDLSSPPRAVPSSSPAPRAQSMGAAPRCDKEGGRQMFDKNELRSMHSEMFQANILKMRSELLLAAEQREEEAEGTRGALQVFLRKRPISEKEQHVRGDYDALTVIPRRPYCNEVVLHNCQFQADLKTPFITHIHYGFDCVFPEDVSNEVVYEQTAQPLVQIALNGGMATMFMFGQTGSGKTFTMTAIEDLAARDLFASKATEVADADETQNPEDFLSLQFYELRGNRCYDLLVPAAAARDTRAAASRKGEPAPELRLREQVGSEGSTYVADGALVMVPSNAEDLSTWMRRAHACRATSATEANDVSSRSHAVCMLRLQSGGQLLLIDCAGTERRKDAMYHSKERQQEGAEINASLHALKECIRHFTSQNSVPSHVLRASSLTKILAESFLRPRATRLAVVCTASPCVSDTEHTLSTLRTGVSLCSCGYEREKKQVIEAAPRRRVPHPKSWSPEAVRSWLEELADGAFRDVLEEIPSNFTGQMLVRCTEARCVQLCGGQAHRGHELFQLLHEEMKKAR